MISFDDVIAELRPLPSDPELAWQVVVEAAFKAVKAEKGTGLSILDSAELWETLHEFVTELSEQLGVEFDYKLNTGSAAADYYFKAIEKKKNEFKRKANRKLVGSILAEVKSENGEGEQTLELSNSGLVKIFGLTRDLRLAVEVSELEEDRKEKLSSHLNEFEAMLTAKKVNTRKAFAILALIGAGLAGTTGTLADAPGAFETIGKVTAYLGLEQEAADAVKMIEQGAVPLGLPSPSDVTTTGNAE